jgi:hypothetical protein
MKGSRNGFISMALALLYFTLEIIKKLNLTVFPAFLYSNKKGIQFKVLINTKVIPLF